MAKIEFRLSRKESKETGMCEILVRFFSTGIDVYSKTGVFVKPDFFEYNIDRKKTAKANVVIPENQTTATTAKAMKHGYILRESGEIVTKNRRLRTKEVIYHEAQQKTISELAKYIINEFNATSADEVKANKNWLKILVDKYNHPEKYAPKDAETKPTFYELAEEYLDKKQFSYDYIRGFRVLLRDMARYESFVRATDKQRKDFTLDIDKLTREDIEDLIDYLKNEAELQKEYPELFKRLLKLNPLSTGKNAHRKLEIRGNNTIIMLVKRLKAMLAWCYDEGKTTNRPFNGVKIGTDKYGTPYYISIEERNKIAEFDFSNSKHLETQRDIFVFQCLTGCRVGDLMKLTADNITNGILVYDPHKTKDEGSQPVQARVPLHAKALALVEKYKGVDSKGRLFPFISSTKYNVAIKEIFSKAGITRNVVVRDPKTGESETKPINEIASSHLARRTFVGNAYFMASDPSIICKMSGHTENSRAFARYRKIEDRTLREVINKIG